ncbi:hypothetical protein [Nesterenkonia sp.]|uniref:hypothetical protein n=1 Tax=Nesterenkonia sp. TaxID=704201 RepID=UPI00261A0C57|nr:hypothetical protein [Nesterenkonia sp.]
MSTPPNDNSPQWGAAGAQGPGPGGDPYAGQPGSKYGTSGYDPSTSYNAPMDEPRQYSQLKTMTLASLGLYVLSQLVGLFAFFSDDVRAAVEEEIAGQPGATPEMVDGAIMFSVVLAAVIGLIAIGLYLLVYFGLAKVKGWARITGIVLAIVGLVFTIGGFAMDTSMLASGMGLVSLVITVAWAAVTIFWLVLAFSAPVRDYMEQHR